MRRSGPASCPNLRAAYLHVLADALSSVLAIAALLAGRTFGWTWMDPIMGIVGGAVIARWSWSLLADTARVLLDGEVSEERPHVWRVGPRHLAAIVAIVSESPRGSDHYRARLGGFPDLVHVTVEVHAGGLESVEAHVDKQVR